MFKRKYNIAMSIFGIGQFNTNSILELEREL